MRPYWRRLRTAAALVPAAVAIAAAVPASASAAPGHAAAPGTSTTRQAAPHHSGTTPPAGSFVYWNISSYGHVGIADGSGGFYSTSIGGKIGHASSVSYFSHYLGWTPAVPHQ